MVESEFREYDELGTLFSFVENKLMVVTACFFKGSPSESTKLKDNKNFPSVHHEDSEMVRNHKQLWIDVLHPQYWR